MNRIMAVTSAALVLAAVYAVRRLAYRRFEEWS